jgi:hypothetical protein
MEDHYVSLSADQAGVPMAQRSIPSQHGNRI